MSSIASIAEGAAPGDLRLPNGTVVSPHGLTSAKGSQLNGLYGTILSFNEENGRYMVSFDGDHDQVTKAHGAERRVLEFFIRCTEERVGVEFFFVPNALHTILSIHVQTQLYTPAHHSNCPRKHVEH